MAQNVSKANVEINTLILRRFKKRPIGLDGTGRLDGLTRTQTAIYVVLFDAACNEKIDDIHYSHDTIAAKAMCSRGTVVRAMKALSGAGYIGYESRGRVMVDSPRGKYKRRPRNLTNRYWLTEKILHVLPYDPLTGDKRDIEAEEKMKPVLSEKGRSLATRLQKTEADHDALDSCSEQKCNRSFRESINIDTLTAADAAGQKAPLFEKGGEIPEERTKGGEPSNWISPDGSGEGKTEVMKRVLRQKRTDGDASRPQGEDHPPAPAAPPRRAAKKAVIDPIMRDQVIHVVCAYRRALAARKMRDDMFFTHQYEQVAALIELAGSLDQAVGYIEYVVSGWSRLIGTTGVRDADRLLDRPTLNQMLAPWRAKIWLARMSGKVSKRTLRRKSADKRTIEKLQKELNALKCNPRGGHTRPVAPPAPQGGDATQRAKEVAAKWGTRFVQLS